MKSKGLNFMEAVEEMKKGKKVRRKEFSEKWFCKLSKLDKTKFITSKGDDCNFNLREFEATDWEVVEDDEDWNLADNYYMKGTCLTATHTTFNAENVKKCKELILQDLEKECEENAINNRQRDLIINSIINKRFGDLNV